MPGLWLVFFGLINKFALLKNIVLLLVISLFYTVIAWFIFDKDEYFDET